MRRSKLVLLVLVLALAALPAVSSLAKPLYCNYACNPPYNGTSSSVCTCPLASFNGGDIVTCGDYWGGYCDGYWWLQASEDTSPLTVDELSAILAATPELPATAAATHADVVQRPAD